MKFTLVSMGWSLVFLVLYLTPGENIVDKLLTLLYWIAAKTFFRGFPMYRVLF